MWENRSFIRFLRSEKLSCNGQHYIFSLLVSDLHDKVEQSFVHWAARYSLGN